MLKHLIKIGIKFITLALHYKCTKDSSFDKLLAVNGHLSKTGSTKPRQCVFGYFEPIQNKNNGPSFQIVTDSFQGLLVQNKQDNLSKRCSKGTPNELAKYTTTSIAVKNNLR